MCDTDYLKQQSIKRNTPLIISLSNPQSQHETNAMPTAVLQREETSSHDNMAVATGLERPRNLTFSWVYYSRRLIIHHPVMLSVF
jgi:hypothetical protein